MKIFKNNIQDNVDSLPNLQEDICDFIKAYRSVEQNMCKSHKEYV